MFNYQQKSVLLYISPVVNFSKYIEGAKKVDAHLCCSNDNRSPAIFFDRPAIRLGASGIHVTSTIF
jgi:hypothetical protein